MITDDTVERVREAADIVAIIGEHVALRRAGSAYRGPCPFHQGTHPNFSVLPQKGIYHCFVCHESGDVFTFLQKHLGLDFPGAVRQVAERVGIPVDEVRPGRAREDPRQPLWDANETAAGHFRTLLWDSRGGEEARAYLDARHVSRELAERFELGLAPREPDALERGLTALGMDVDRLTEAGLLIRRELDGPLRARFRRRLMFPIRDAAGHVVGFGGRLLEPGEPKYLNSAESPTFSKATLLYGLHLAKQAIRRGDRVLLVEGYFDVLRLAGAGFDWTVAPLGTALTEAQAALVRRYARRAYLLYDSDPAGLRATFRSGDMLLRQGISVEVVTLPAGEDPDTFVDRHGAARLEAQLGGAIDVFERKIQLLERGGWFGDLRRKRRAIDRLLPTIRAAADPLTRDIYLTRASELAGVGKDILAREAATEPGSRRASSLVAPPDARAMAGGAGSRRRSGAAPVSQREPGTAAERELVRVMLHHPEQVEGIAERAGEDDVRDPSYREIFAALLRAERSDATDAAWLDTVSPAAAEIARRLLETPGAVGDLSRTVQGSLAVLRVRTAKRMLAELDRMLPLAPDREKDAIIRRKQQIRDEIRALGGVGIRQYGKSQS